MCAPTPSCITDSNHLHSESNSHHSHTKAVSEPPMNASDAEWLEYASAVAEANGIPAHIVTALINNKGAPNFSGHIPSNDGTGEKLYGPMLVHGGLLEGGCFAGEHALTREDGTAFTAEDLENNPAAGIDAGIQHLKQLVEMYDGNVQMALNHYQTGDPHDSSHDLGNLVSETSETGHSGHSATSGHTTSSGHSESSDHNSTPAHTSHPERPALVLPTGFSEHQSHGAGGHGPAARLTAQDSDTPSVRAPYTGTVEGPLTGDIDPGHGDGHPNDHVGEASHGHGFLLNADAHNSAVAKVFGKSPDEVVDYMVSKLDAMGAYNAGQNDVQKTIGAYLVMNLALKYHMMPSSLFANETEAGLVYGEAKTLAMNGDAEGLRSLIESNGGSTFGLDDAELTSIWGTNEHNNLHAVLFGNKDLANAVHMTSLNDNDSLSQDGMNPGRSGGYNNKGEYPQWGWFEGLSKLSGWFPELTPAA